MSTRKRKVDAAPPLEIAAQELVRAARCLRDALIAAGTHPYTVASLHALIADAEAEDLVAPEGEGER